MDNGKWKIVSLLAGIRTFLGTNMHKCPKNTKEAHFSLFLLRFSLHDSFRALREE